MIKTPPNGHKSGLHPAYQALYGKPEEPRHDGRYVLIVRTIHGNRLGTHLLTGLDSAEALRLFGACTGDSPRFWLWAKLINDHTGQVWKEAAGGFMDSALTELRELAGREGES